MTEQEKAKLIEQANIATNSAYLLIEAANSFLVDLESMLSKIEMGTLYGERKRFKSMLNEAKKMREMTRKAASPLGEIDCAEIALGDADYLYDYMKLLVDRVGDSDDKKVKVRALLFNVTSELNSY
jgi:hypothetical protein